MSIVLIILASLLSCAGQLSQKQAALCHSRRKILHWLLLSVVFLGFGMLVWLVVLQQVDVSIAYPMLSLNFIFVTLAAALIWHETISFRHWIGVVTIIAGIILLGGAA